MNSMSSSRPTKTSIRGGNARRKTVLSRVTRSSSKAVTLREPAVNAKRPARLASTQRAASFKVSSDSSVTLGPAAFSMARGDVYGLAGDPILGRQVVLDGLYHDLARIEPDPNRDRRTRRRRPRTEGQADGILHPVGRETRPDRVVFLRDWRAEHDHDPVAEDLGDSAAKLVSRIDQQLQDRHEQIVRLFGIATRDHGGRLDDIGEQHGGEFPLTVERLERIID